MNSSDKAQLKLVAKISVVVFCVLAVVGVAGVALFARSTSEDVPLVHDSFPFVGETENPTSYLPSNPDVLEGQVVPETEPEVIESPAAGTKLTSQAVFGIATVLSGGDGFSILDSRPDFGSDKDDSTITTFDRAGNQLATIRGQFLDGPCGAYETADGKGIRRIITVSNTTVDAEGIKAGRTWSTFSAWDSVSGDKLWSTRLNDGWGDCATSTSGVIEDLSTTLDAKWAAISPVGGYSLLLDLETGEPRYEDRKMIAIGNYFLESQGDYLDDAQIIRDPSTLKELGRVDRIYDPFEINDVSPGAAGSSTSAVISPDGSLLFGNQVAKNGGSRTTAFKIPSGTVAWQKPASYDSGQFGASNRVLVHLTGVESAGIGGSSVGTGEPIWKLPSATVCAMTSSQLLLLTQSNQQSIVDLMTGKQVSYSETSFSNCPEVIAGGIGVQYGDSSVKVIQVLVP